MPAKTTTRATTKRPTRRTARKQPRQPLLVRAARASLTRYDRRAIGLVRTRYYRLTGALGRRLHLNATRVRTLSIALLVLVAVASVLAQAAGAGR
jgi:hypothetical protein